MKPKTIIGLVVLAVIAVAVGVWVIKKSGPAKAIGIGEAVARQGTNTSADRIRPDGVAVINFHGAMRCRTCLRIGELAKKTLDEEFTEAQKVGKVSWEHVNYQEPANAHFVKDYELGNPTILLTQWKDGKEVKWNRLDGVWDLVEDESTFRAYVAESVRQLLENP